MQWKDILIIFLVVLAAILASEYAVKPILAKKDSKEQEQGKQ